MKKIAKATIIWAVGSVVALVVAAVCARLLVSSGHAVSGGYVIPGVIIGILVWKMFLKDDKGEVARLRRDVKDLNRQLAEKNASRLNVVELNPILHVAVLKVDTSFVRPYVRESGKSTFNGALRADLCVEYGVRLEDAKFRYDPAGNILYIADFNPGIISYSRKRLIWDFAKTYRSVSLFGHELYEVSDKDGDVLTSEMCEKLRAELEAEIDSRKVSEFDWLSPLVADQVMDVIRLMLGRGDLQIQLVESADGNFVALPELKRIAAAN